MINVGPALHLCGQLLGYPGPGTRAAAEQLCQVLRDELPDAMRPAEGFLAVVAGQDQRRLEEVYTQTFDITAACALDVGWHLFGEDYIRGLFLVRMREELRKYGLTESVELPDHLSHVLMVVAAMPDEEARRFVHACVLPAVAKIDQALVKQESPYRHVVSCLEMLLVSRWGRPVAAADDDRGAPTSQPDLLRAFPIADVPCACGSSPTEPAECLARDAVPASCVPRETEFPSAIGDAKGADAALGPAETTQLGRAGREDPAPADNPKPFISSEARER